MRVQFSSGWSKRLWRYRALLPLAALYYSLSTLYKSRVKPYRAKVPVICVGNVTVGGAGKTPVCIVLADMLTRKGVQVAYASRGYKGKLKGPVCVEVTHHADDVGDEPLLLRRYAPVFVAKKRELAVQAAVSAGAQVVILDDGLQNPSVEKNLSLLIVDGLTGIGNGYLLPAGPLREPLPAALSRADAVVMIGHDQTCLIPRLKGVPVLHMTPDIVFPDALRHENIVAFAGIGHPEKFFHALKGVSTHLIEAFPFPDHYPYQPSDLERLMVYAAQKGAKLVTTEKDIMRIPARYHTTIEAIPLVLNMDKKNEEQLHMLLQGIDINYGNGR